MTDLVAQYNAALAELRCVLQADGYGLEADAVSDAGADLRITVTSPDACADCLVPEPILRQMISAQLAPHGLRLGGLAYPSSAVEAH